MSNERNTAQNAVYRAWAKMLEVETRETGWNSRDANSARRDYREATQNYQEQFGEPHKTTGNHELLLLPETPIRYEEL